MYNTNLRLVQKIYIYLNNLDIIFIMYITYNNNTHKFQYSVRFRLFYKNSCLDRLQFFLKKKKKIKKKSILNKTIKSLLFKDNPLILYFFFKHNSILLMKNEKL